MINQYHSLTELFYTVFGLYTIAGLVVDNIRFEHKVNGEWQADSTAVDQFAAKVEAYKTQPATEKKKPATQKASTLQSSLRQLYKVCELLARSAELYTEQLSVLDSAIAEVRKHAPVKAK
jgi:hypothetical protein